MNVYIEYVIIDNMVINSLLLWGAGITLRRKIVWRNILLSAALGTLLAGLLPLFPLAGVFAVAVKILTGLIMVLIAGKYKSVKDYVLVFLLFLAYTFLLGGLITALLYGSVGVASALTINYMSEVPVGLLVLGAAVFAYLVFRLGKHIFRQRDYGGFTRTARLDIFGHEYTALAFIDSGNLLYDKESGLPVVVVNKNLIREGLAEIVAKCGKTGGHYMEISTAGGVTRMMILKPEKLIIYHKDGKETNIIDRFRIGIAGEEMKFDMLLHPGIFE